MRLSRRTHSICVQERMWCWEVPFPLAFLEFDAEDYFYDGGACPVWYRPYRCQPA